MVRGALRVRQRVGYGFDPQKGCISQLLYNTCVEGSVDPSVCLIWSIRLKRAVFCKRLTHLSETQNKTPANPQPKPLSHLNKYLDYVERGSWTHLSVMSLLEGQSLTHKKNYIYKFFRYKADGVIECWYIITWLFAS